MLRPARRNKLISVAFGGMLALCGIVWNDTSSAQVDDPQTHGPRTIDQEMDHLTRELELTPAEKTEIRPILLKHRQRIQALFDQHQSTPREALRPRIHAISNDTHHEIEGLLTDHQRQLAKAMQARMHGENRPPS